MDKETEKTLKKEKLQKLRDARKPCIAAAAARVKEQKKALDAITGELAKGEATVPEISGATGLATAEVLWYVATLKKYGEVLEGRKDGGYYRYRLAAEPRAEG